MHQLSFLLIKHEHRFHRVDAVIGSVASHHFPTVWDSLREWLTPYGRVDAVHRALQSYGQFCRRKDANGG
jgi:sulfite reductase beta subunit-like hemoprotein